VWQGVGFSLIFVALSTAALATIARPEVTAATGLYNVSRQVFGSVGIAVAATQLTAGVTRYHAILAEQAGSANAAAVSWLQSVTGAMMARTGAEVAVSRRHMAALKALTRNPPAYSSTGA